MKKKRSFWKVLWNYNTSQIITIFIVLVYGILAIGVEAILIKFSVLDGNVGFGNKITRWFVILVCEAAASMVVFLLIWYMYIFVMYATNPIRYCMAMRRFCYLPMSKEECEKRKISSANEYIQFVSNQLVYQKFIKSEITDVYKTICYYFCPDMKDVIQIFEICRDIFPDGAIEEASIWAEKDQNRIREVNWVLPLQNIQIFNLIRKTTEK